MAQIALNKFLTIRHNITTSNVGIYTAPTGVASIVLLAQVSNVGTGSSVPTVTAAHSRSSVDARLVKQTPVPPNDSVNLLSGRLILETGDVFKIQGSVDGTMEIVLSVLESAKR
jgi:hypothetical protein